MGSRNIQNQTSTHEKRLLNLKSLRLEELKQVLPSIPHKSHILELGAGAGWQAQELQKRGHSVQAIDLETSNYQEYSVFPVIPYDGVNIPFERETFDVIFSSNVLEHVQHLDKLEKEIQRVLKPQGIAIHVLPSGSWRLWTSISHPAWVIRRVSEILRQYHTNPSSSIKKQISSNARWYHVIWPNRHGEKGNHITEVYYFSRHAWRHHFERHGWKLTLVKPLGLFYTGNQILHQHIDFRQRAFLSGLLGSSTCVYICMKPHHSPPLNS
jgi:2-polyprenyl-3-methyl-5-hydroxy-6-metoxy-1,4-benzoquinol methylase